MPQIYQYFNITQLEAFGPKIARFVSLSFSSYPYLAAPWHPCAAICFDDYDQNTSIVIAFGEFIEAPAGKDYIRWLAQTTGLTTSFIETETESLVTILKDHNLITSPHGAVMVYDLIHQQFHWVVVGPVDRRNPRGPVCLWSGYSPTKGSSRYILYNRGDMTSWGIAHKGDTILCAQDGLALLGDLELGRGFTLLGRDLQQGLDPSQINMADDLLFKALGENLRGALFALHIHQ